MNRIAPPPPTGAPPNSTQGDSFLASLQVISAHYGRSAEATVLTAGLPLVDGRLTAPLVPRAAGRVGLKASIVRTQLQSLVPLELPAILALRDGKPFVLLSVEEGRNYRIYLPFSGERIVSAQDVEDNYSGIAITLRPVFESPDAKGDKTKPGKGSWFWPFAIPYKRSYTAVIVAALMINIIGLATPLFIMNVYDRVIPNKAMETLWVFVAGLSLALVFELLLKMMRAQILDRVGRKVDIQVACNLIEKILNTRLSDRPSSTGAMANRMQEYELVREFFSSNTLMLFVDMAFFLLISIVIYTLAGWVVIIPLSALAVVLLFGLSIQQKLANVVRQAQDESALRHSLLVDSMYGIETIKTVRAEGHILRRWENLAGAAARSSEEAKYLSSISLNVTSFVQQIITVMVIVASVYQFTNGHMTMGAIIATVMLSNRLMAPLSQVAMMFSRLHYVKLAFGHFDEIMEKSDERVSGSSFVNRRISAGTITFRGVEFSYPGATSPILKNLDLEIRPGERLAIIGRIGSGKTTLGRLLTGLYFPTAGEILIDGVDIRQYHPHEIRSAISLVVQEADLFHGTVRENIIMAKPTAMDAEIVEAAKLAGVDEIVAGHPQGYEMDVGERGSRLSGGQRQCVALARSFLGDPKAIFLDEPSSSMDLQSERAFIQRLSVGIDSSKTLIVATHRQSMLELVDRLLVLDGGRIVRDGSKDQVIEGLIRSKGENS